MKNKKTFTLIEILIVVVIIGILATALIPKIKSVQARARDTKRVQDTQQISIGLQMYYNDNAIYPIAISDPVQGGRETSLTTGWMTSISPKYLSIPLLDPINDGYPSFWLKSPPSHMYVYYAYDLSLPVRSNMNCTYKGQVAVIGVTTVEAISGHNEDMRAFCTNGRDRSTEIDYTTTVLYKGEYTHR